MQALSCQCACGQAAWHVSAAGVESGTRLICYCNSCRAAHHHLRGTAEGLTEGQGVEILHTTPRHFALTKGAEHLRCMKLSEKGVLRWYVACCNTPVANSLSHINLAFLGVVLPAEAQFPARADLGKPMECNTKYRQEGSSAPLTDTGYYTVASHVVRRAITGAFRQKGNAFAMSGVQPEVLTSEARRAAYEQATAPR